MNPIEIKVEAVGDEIISVDDVKTWGRIPGDGHDSLLSEMITATRELHEQWTRLSYVPKSLKVLWDKVGADNTVFLPFGPVVLVDMVRRIYDDGSLSDPLVEGTDFYVTGMDFKTLHFYTRWTSAGKVITGLQVEYDVGYGYGSGEGAIPAQLKQCLYRHIITDYKTVADTDEPHRPVLYDWVKEALAPYRKEVMWL